MKPKKKAGAKGGAKSKAKAPARKKPKVRASSRAKPKAKAKSRAPSRAKPKAKTKAAPKKGKGLTVVELFQLKQQREQGAAAGGEAWKHRKDLPPQDQHGPEDAKAGAAGRKSGFGGVRHH
jgi:hypothetical protein